jgi:homoserine kinase type II
MTAKRLETLISDHYDIGDLITIRKLDRGYVNTSYELETISGGKERRYFLRKYKKGTKEEEVRFEHSIIQHLMKRDFKIAAGIVHTKEGHTYVQEFEDGETENESEPVFVSVFEFLPGEDRYTWDDPACSREELGNSAAVLAKYHNTVYDLIPQGKRHEPRIIELLPRMADNLKNQAKRVGRTPFDDFFLENLDSILESIDRTRDRINPEEYGALVHLAIHCDYHPGNLKFQDGRVTGLFDFDWSKIEARCFDVALAITYFCSAWSGKKDGQLQVDRAALFLDAYQKTFHGPQGIGPLDDLERTYLPHMIRASNLYVLHWDVEDFYAKNPDPAKYVRYLRHHVLVMNWLEDKKNHDDLGRMTGGIVVY